MIWLPILFFLAYTGLSLLSLGLWWLIYDRVLTPRHSVREALFGSQPNTAVALDMAGGFLALGLLNYSILSTPVAESFWLDLEGTALVLLGTVLLLGLLRLTAMAGLRAWFRDQKDTHGEIISFNNELFGQRNLATSLFSTTLYGILVAGLMEQDLLNLSGFRLAFTWNMLGTWLLGLALMLIHSWSYLGFGTANNILHESFHDNNPAASSSLLGLAGGMLLLNHALIGLLPPEAHLFNTWTHWANLVLALLIVLGLRLLLALGLRGTLGVNLRKELVIHDNPAWGVLDGAIIFALLLLLNALMV